MKKVALYGILQEVKTMADKTYKVVFRTNELPSEDAGILMGLVHNEGHCLFASESLQESDIPKEVPEHKKQKSSSQRLYSVLFVLWKQRGEQGDFDTFRKQYMERVIDGVKSKLEPKDF